MLSRIYCKLCSMYKSGMLWKFPDFFCLNMRAQTVNGELKYTFFVGFSQRFAREKWHFCNTFWHLTIIDSSEKYRGSKKCKSCSYCVRLTSQENISEKQKMFGKKLDLENVSYNNIVCCLHPASFVYFDHETNAVKISLPD